MSILEGELHFDFQKTLHAMLFDQQKSGEDNYHDIEEMPRVDFIVEKEDELFFIEVKDQPLTLGDLGQLWGYTELINPIESFLVSSEGLGSLVYLLKVLKREDLLVYGMKKERMMKICKWDQARKTIDYSTLIPKL